MTASRLARLPLRVRLVAGFSATMLLVLLAAGGFVYWRVHFALDRQVNEDLTEISTRLTPLITDTGAFRTDASASDRSEIYQVLDAQGQVLTASPTAGPEPLLDTADARQALTAPVRRDIGALLPIKNHPLRAYGVPLPNTGGPAKVLVVAVRRDHRDEALLELLLQLGIAGLGALVLTSAVGYLLTRSALRPVERYRAQADQIVHGVPGVRLGISEQRDDEVTRLGRTLNTMLDALETALERERDFVRDASHELRTPLTLLTTRVQLALRRPRTVTEHEEILREVRTDLDRLTRLAEQLLRAETHGLYEDRSVDLAHVAGQAVHERNRTADGEPPRPEPRFHLQAPAPVEVAVGEVELAQVVGNLLDNALLHGQPPVHVHVDRVGAVGRLQVQDAGPGMDAQLLATATRRFSRAAESRSRPGFGLGLALVAAAVTRAGGELRLCSAGHHQSSGVPTPSTCEHGPAMTVTVLLPTTQSASGDSSRLTGSRHLHV
ncbi:Signal transduction histidine kinase [Friedmanniella luteola]|uniref:histidine kinase n=1 Tax=Friedmanniella luteola TaxID=546871 RepID=A0A1H1WUL1_9ACTN|nr:ATP-binding protein [Friedmanniella luteola]SDT00330.1 Signal transduction histidine kinase [Friedmanniella luteola]